MIASSCWSEGRPRRAEKGVKYACLSIGREDSAGVSAGEKATIPAHRLGRAEWPRHSMARAVMFVPGARRAPGTLRRRLA